MKNDWNTYFYTHYRPDGKDWGNRDLMKYRRWYASWIAYIEKEFRISFQGKRALELGCGIGAVCSLLHDRGCNVTGSDIAKVMVNHAKKISPSIPFLTYDVTKSFPKKQTFDYVLAFEVLEHVRELEKGIKNIFSLLDTDGVFIGSTPYPYPKNMLDPTHVNVHPPEFWKKLFHRHGFTSITTIPISFFPLLWRFSLYHQPILPWYIKNRYIVSTTLIIAKK